MLLFFPRTQLRPVERLLCFGPWGWGQLFPFSVIVDPQTKVFKSIIRQASVDGLRNSGYIRDPLTKVCALSLRSDSMWVKLGLKLNKNKSLQLLPPIFTLPLDIHSPPPPPSSFPRYPQLSQAYTPPPPPSLNHKLINANLSPWFLNHT